MQSIRFNPPYSRQPQTRHPDAEGDQIGGRHAPHGIGAEFGRNAIASAAGAWRSVNDVRGGRCVGRVSG